MQSQESRVGKLLGRLDLGTFELKEYRKIDDCQYSSSGYQPIGKILQLNYHCTLNADHLITHLQLELASGESFGAVFQIGQIEGCSLPGRNLGGTVRWCGAKQSDESKNWVVGCACISQTLKVSLLLKREFGALFGESLELRKERDKQSTQQNVLKMVRHAIKDIYVCGYHLHTSPSASELVPLLNISQSFKLAHRYHQAAQTDVLTSLTLFAARRFVQAAEMLRQVSNFYLNNYTPASSYLDFSKLDKTISRDQQKQGMEGSLLSRSFSTGRVLEGGPFLYKAAKIELLLADTVSQPSLLGAKLQAYNRANAYASGITSPPKINIRFDYHDAILTIGQNILPFLLKILTDKSDILKISALKSIEFFFENLGCSLAGWMGATLQKVISIYPKERERVSESAAVGGRWKLIIDHTNRVLQSLVSLVGGLSRKYLMVIFEEIILPSISDEYRNELRVYLLRFAQKILQSCGSDLKLSLPYLSHLFSLASASHSATSQLTHHIAHNLTHLSHRVIHIIKHKILGSYYHLPSLAAICAWVRESLLSHCQAESVAPVALPQLLDLTVAIYSHNKKASPAPIEPVIYLLNLALSQPKLPFEKLLHALVVLLNSTQRTDTQDLCSQITARAISRLRAGGVKLKELRVLEKIVEMLQEVQGEWLQDFLECIPHSNFDQIYAVFDLLLRKSTAYMCKSRLQAVIQTLFNQYTVKGKAHQLSKDRMITHLLQKISNSLLLLLEVCLFDNPQPHIQAYSRTKLFGKEQLVDSKQFRLRSEIFTEKINLLVMVLSKQELLVQQFRAIFTLDLVCKLHGSFGSILRTSNNSKVKAKVLLLISHLTTLLSQLNSPPLSPAYLLFFKAHLDLLKSFIIQSKNSKLHHYCAVNLTLLFQLLPRTGLHTHSSHESIDFMEQQVTVSFKVPSELSVGCVQSILGSELVKVWPCILVLVNSPWENIRQTSMLSLVYNLRFGLSAINKNTETKLKQLIKNLINHLLHSPDHTQRLTGVKMVALLLGMAANYISDQQMSSQLRHNGLNLRQELQWVVQLEQDWNQQVSQCSKTVSRSCLSQWQRENMMGRKLQKRSEGGLCLSMQNEYLDLEEKRESGLELIGNLEQMLQMDESSREEPPFPPLTPQLIAKIHDFKQSIESIKFQDCSTLAEKESFVDEQPYLEANEEQYHSDKEISNRSEEELLQFEDLGIIELDDEEWAQEQNQLKITQKLPLKKIYKLSPNLASSNKHHRLNNNRLQASSQLENQRIVVDEVQATIAQPLQTKAQEYSGEQDEKAKQWNGQSVLPWEDSNDKQWRQSRGSKAKGREKKGSKKGKASK